MYGYIYKTTCVINGLIYVGQHKATEFKGQHYLGSGRFFKKEVKRLGAENFIVELLDTADSHEELDEKEKYWISLLNSRNENVGYNKAIGGSTGNTGCKQSDLQKETIRTYMTNRVVSDETKLKMSSSAKQRVQKNCGFVVDQTGCIFVHKDTINTTIKKEQLEEYLSLGYIKGRYMPPEFSKNYREKYKNGTYIHLNGIIKFVSNIDLQDWLNNGWKAGKKEK